VLSPSERAEMCKCTERLKWEEMSRSIKNGLGFAKLFSGKGFAKPRLMFLKFGGDFEFCPRGGRVWEGIRAGFNFFDRRFHFFKISSCGIVLIL